MKSLLKMKGKTAQPSSGIGVLGLLFVGMFFLKILEIAPVAGWSWWWVTAPLWGGFALILLILAAFAIWYWRTTK